MKHTKKLASLLLALVLALALALPALAETTTYTITAPSNGHTYEVYQIFTGDLYAETDEGGNVTNRVLSNVKWGENGTGTQGEAVSEEILKELEAATGSDSAKLDVITKYVNLDSTPYNTVVGGTLLTDVPAGYYLIKDVDGALAGQDDSYTTYIVQLVDNVTINPKSGTSEVKKQVKDTNDSTGVTTGWQDSADYDIGDSVPFLLTATLADNMSSYTTYKVVFHDTLSKGLTLDATYSNDGDGNDTTTVASGVTVEIDDTDKTSDFTINAVKNVDGTTTLTISCNDVKALGAGDKSVITVEYTATLNGNAVIGSAGNPNTVKLDYSNNPNWKPGEGETSEDSPTGNTPEDKVTVFTYKAIINKVDSEGTPLTGAAFKLEKLIKGQDGKADTWTLVKEFTVDKENPASSFEFKGLDDGTYKLTETVTPPSYNTIDPIYFIVEATHDVTGADPKLGALTVVLTNENGEKLTEEKDGETVNINLGTIDLSAGSVTTDVVNQKGTTLPETGGVGTTIFYLAGGLLVLAAVVLLVTKKRMSSRG